MINFLIYDDKNKNEVNHQNSKERNAFIRFFKDNFVPLSYVFIFLGIISISCLICWGVYKKWGEVSPLSELAEDPIYTRALGLVNIWLLSEFAWETVHIVFSVMPFVCTVIILHVECYHHDEERYKKAVVTLSIISLSFMSISYFLKPYPMAQMFRKAFESLRLALIEYESAKEKTPAIVQNLCDAIAAGEKYIGSAL